MSSSTLLDTPSSSPGDHFVFNAIDYSVFAFMLSISAGIGVYFGFFNKGADTTEEYLMGGRRMKTIPIAISLVASQLSAISIMTFPGEMYSYGVNYVFNVATMIINIPILIWIVIPVFYNNNISNCYEYLEMRFNRGTRELLTVAFMGTIFVILPVYNFVPSLAFAQVTNVNIHVVNTIISSICVFYTMFGGIKAVVWTDVVQATIMVVSVVFIGILGIIKVGGLGEVFRKAAEGGRLDVDYTFDLKTRATFWNTMISSIFVWVSYVGYNQSCVQRIVSLPTLAKAQKSLIYFGFGYLIIMGFNCFSGIIMYARYFDCDPIKAGFVEKPDKLVPYFVQDIVGHLKGIPGLFISCVFSAALSSMSAAMNALAGVAYMDYIKPRIRHTETKANLIMKGIVFIFGIYCILGGIVVEKFTSILQIMFTIGGVTFGAIFGVFTMGMLVPKVHGRAAFWSVVISMGTMLIIVLGAQGKLHYATLPTSVEGCPAGNFSSTLMANSSVLSVQKLTSEKLLEDSFDIFEMSFNWYIVIGCLIVFIIGIPLSYILPPEKNTICDPKLLSPIVQRFYKYELAQTQELPDLKVAKDFK